ncbi:hypothetical protein OJF2_62360 [Aquisphaera giovannonii]|uniref:Uncharacterized protein n=1 Tax=Aquisphaera giovannonii TaxID=406548 RepID=A0A5B9WC69_9BACT|nr:hypothetical protein [Aquisphaera giovannonii]QEH37645.1 hypothetical protein OJF2_62360 [Aquisphaera giovannonii]
MRRIRFTIRRLMAITAAACVTAAGLVQIRRDLTPPPAVPWSPPSLEPPAGPWFPRPMNHGEISFVNMEDDEKGVRPPRVITLRDSWGDLRFRPPPAPPPPAELVRFLRWALFIREG